MSESSLYEKIFRAHFDIDKMILETKTLDPNDLVSILSSILDGKEVCTITELLMDKHSACVFTFPVSQPLSQKLLFQRSLVIQMIQEKYISPESYLRVLYAFLDGKKLYFNSSMMLGTRVLTKQERSVHTHKKVSNETKTVNELPITKTASQSTYTQQTKPIAFNEPIKFEQPALTTYTALAEKQPSIAYLRSQGMPIYDIEATEKTFQILFSAQEKAKLFQLQSQLADEVYERIRQNRFTVDELRNERAYIAVLPGVLTINLMRQKMRCFRAEIWYHTLDFAQTPIKPGVMLGFGKPFCTQANFTDQRRALLEFNKEKNIPFRPALTCEEIVGWLLDPKARTPEGMMFTGYNRTMDTFQGSDVKWRVCVGNFNRGGIHIDKKQDSESFHHIGISRSYKLLLHT